MESKENNNVIQAGTVYPLFKTVEEMIGYARDMVPPKNIMLQKAEGESLCVGDYLDNLNKICNMLVCLGVRKGSNVGVFLGNCMEYAYFYLAVGRLGATIVPLNQFLVGETLNYVMNHCDIEFLITSEHLYREKMDPISKFLSGVKCVIFLDEEVSIETVGNKVSFWSFREYSDIFEPQWEVSSSDPFVIWLTSGTTGLPKGVVSTQEYLLQRVCFSANYFAVNSSDVIYFILPMYHIPFFCWGFPLALISGCTLVYMDWFSASKFWEYAAKYKATLVYSTGTIIPLMLKKEINDHESIGKESIRIWSAWPLDQPEVVFKRWPRTSFVEGYGLSEYAIAAITTHHEAKAATSQGEATPFTELKICDPETGEEMPVGKPGEIVLRSKLGPGFMMRDYYKSPKETAETIKADGWLYSGDMGYLDSENQLHFVDRLKDSVRVAGENVPSVQLEAMITGHPKIMEVAVVGVKGELGHDEIVAHVIPREGESLSASEFFKFCEQIMPYYMIPRHLCLRNEFPKTANFKVQKFELRKSGLGENSFDRKMFLKK